MSELIGRQTYLRRSIVLTFVSSNRNNRRCIIRGNVIGIVMAVEDYKAAHALGGPMPVHTILVDLGRPSEGG